MEGLGERAQDREPPFPGGARMGNYDIRFCGKVR